MLHPDPGLMHDVPVLFRLHICSAMVLFMIWPATRLVHVLSAPVGYLARPYVVYRSRRPEDPARPERAGWERARIRHAFPENCDDPPRVPVYFYSSSSGMVRDFARRLDRAVHDLADLDTRLAASRQCDGGPARLRPDGVLSE